MAGRRVALVHWFGAYLWRAVVLAAALAGAALVIQVAAWWSPAAWWALAAAVLAAAIAGRGGAGTRPGRALGRGAGADWPRRACGAADRAGGTGRSRRRAGPRSGSWARGLPAPPRCWSAFGPSRRILVTDAVLDTHADDEVEVIVAHELAHHRRGDAWWTAAMAAGALALGLYAAARVLPLAAGAFALQGPGDAAALPLVALVCGGVAALLAPLVNLASRAQERRADRDALAWTGNAPALVRTLKRLSAAHLTEDRPPGWSVAFFHRHPAVAERIAAAEAWSGNASHKAKSERPTRH